MERISKTGGRNSGFWKALPLVPVLALMPACGALTSAANPKVAWALGEHAPLVVVVDRASAAEVTSKEVDRLLTATPVDGQWPKRLELTDDQIRQVQKDQAARLIYDHSPYKVVASVVWARVLPNIKTEAASGTGVPADTASNDGTPASNTMPAESSEGTTAAEQTADSVAPAPAAAPPRPSLLAAIAPEIAGGYLKFEDDVAKVGRLEAQIEVEKHAGSAPGATPVDEKAHEAKIRERDLAEAAIKPAREAFIALCKSAAAKANPEVRDHLGRALVNLRQAVEDAKVANGAAVVGYPMAIPGITNQVLVSAQGNVTDYVFERTGKRLDAKQLKVGATFDGKKVGVSVSGLTPEDLGKIEIDAVVSAAIARTEQFAGDAVSLVPTAARTQTRLDFDDDVLDALIDGFKAGGWASPESAYVPDQAAVAINSGAPPPPRASGALGTAAAIGGIFGGN